MGSKQLGIKILWLIRNQNFNWTMAIILPFIISYLKSFQEMNTQYFKNYINLRQDTRKAYECYMQRIHRSFSDLKNSHNNNTCIKFQSELNAFKDFKNIKNKDKQDIYRYFVERNVANFHFLRNNHQIQMRILKLTKTPLDNYELNWKEVWERLLKNEPEPSAIKLYSELIDFLKNIRHLYNPNNAVEVVDYFISKHSLYNDNLFLFISLFVNLSNKTSSDVFKNYFTRLIELYEINQLKAVNLLVMFINSSKFKNSQISEEIYEQLNNIIIYSLTTPNPDKKDSIEQKFNTQTSTIIVKMLGKCNKHSVSLLHQVFQIIKNFIRPFEDSKKPLKFLYLIVTGLVKRIETDQSCRAKISKLKAKQEKKQRNAAKKQSQIQQSEQESTITQPQQKSEIKEPAKQQVKGEEAKQDEEESSEEQSNQNDSDEDEQAAKIEKMVSMELDIEENSTQKVNSSQSKIEKLEAILENQITEEVIACFKTFISDHFESIFYVNSKKIVNRLLKEIFKIFPEFVQRSFSTLQKAGNIPQINEQGLISNIRHMAKYLFIKDIRSQPEFLDNVLKILNKIKQNRKMTDVWQIVSIFTQRIPLLDEKDLEKIPDQEKNKFQQKFGQNHDRFYEAYSEQIFECLKRVFVESEHYDQNSSLTMDKYLLDLLTNCYPFYKKRVLKEIEEQIIENNNNFLLTLFHSDIKPSKQFEEELRQLIDNRNIENEENLQLDINVNLILSVHQDINSLKQLIRKYSKKNNYKFLKQCMLNLNNYTLLYDPLKTTLSHYQKKPQLILKQEPTYAYLSEKLAHVYDYSLEILNQLSEQLKQFSANPLEDETYDAIVQKLYGNSIVDFKNMKIQKRKLINELLQILKIIMENLFHQIQEYDGEKNTIVLRESPFKRQSLLLNPIFINIIRNLTFNELFLHDHNIMHNLSLIIENQVFFMYRHQIRLEKEILKKYNKKNQKEELPGESSLININNIFIAKARITQFSILLNKHKDTVSIEPIEKELRILLVAPGNEKSNTINKILVKKSLNMNKQADNLILLLKNSFQSRFFYEKILSLLSEFNTAGHVYTHEQIIQLIDLHVPLIQSQVMKIRQCSLKSLEKFIKTFSKENIMGQVQHALRKYIHREKLELIWIISIVIILKQPIRDTNLEVYLQDIYEYMKELEKLIVSETRIIRRISLFAYAYCFRKAKKAIKRYEEVPVENQKYAKTRTIYELFEDGYIRDEHKSADNISNKQMLKKMQPYTSYCLKVKEEHPLFTKIYQESYRFILSNPELGNAILKQFHIDMAGSVEQVMSMMQNKKHDLAEITMRLLEGCYMYSKLKKLNFDRIEYYFGERFFRYLFDKDAKSNNFQLFYQTKGYIEQHLANLEPYDNQTLVFIYTIDIFTVYQKHYHHLPPQIKDDVEKFLLKIISEIIYKGSGVLYKKLIVIFSKIIELSSLDFLLTFFDNLVKSHEKLPRVTQLLFTIYQENYRKFYEITEFILKQKLQINNNYINILINTIIALPEKFIITEKVNEKFQIMDIQKEIAQKRMQKYKKVHYLLSTNSFNSMLITHLKTYLEEAIKMSEEVQKTEETTQIVKTKNQLIKSIYSIVTNSISAYIQFYETEETIASIIELLQLLFRLFEFKMDHFVDFKQFEETLKNLFSNKYDKISHFQTIVSYIIHNLHKIPLKKQADVIKIMANRPGNFLFIKKEVYKELIMKMIKLEENSMFYKDLLVGISTLLAYAPLTEPEIDQLSLQLPKTQALLLLQCYVLSTLEIGSKFVERILRQSGKDRRNIFCKEILIIRGKKEYLDDEQKYIQWKEIKQYSNPYHYHA